MNHDDYSLALLGAICGDIIGSSYEGHHTKRFNFRLFTYKSRPTDDTIMTTAVAEWIMTGRPLVDTMRQWGQRYPHSGYGRAFKQWMLSPTPAPYNSFGNGSAMRVSACAWACDTLDRVLDKARASAEVTHNHPEGIKGAQATAAAIFLARTGHSKDEIKSYITQTFGYDLDHTCHQLRPTYHFNVTCQGSVPQSIIAFIDSADYESAVRLAVSLGGDADTMGAITGSIAAAFYGTIPHYITSECLRRLPWDIKNTIDSFTQWLREQHNDTE